MLYGVYMGRITRQFYPTFKISIFSTGVEISPCQIVNFENLESLNCCMKLVHEFDKKGESRDPLFLTKNSVSVGPVLPFSSPYR